MRAVQRRTSKAISSAGARVAICAMASVLGVVAFVAVLAGTCALSGCSGSSGAEQAGAQPTRAAERQLRVVSLSPAMTRTLIDLGAGPQVVGRTPWCQGTAAPVVGTLQDRDMGRIAELRPTCILVQASAVDPALERFARDSGAALVAVHIDRLQDIHVMVERVAAALAALGDAEAPARGQALLQGAEDAIARARAQVDAEGATLLLFSVDPPTAFGMDTFVSDLWLALGGTNALNRSGYPELSLEDVVRLDPARIVVVRSAAGAANTVDEAGAATATGIEGAAAVVPPALASLPSALKQRIRVVRAPVLLDPSTAFLLEGPAALAAAAPAPPAAPPAPPPPAPTGKTGARP